MSEAATRESSHTPIENIGSNHASFDQPCRHQFVNNRNRTASFQHVYELIPLREDDEYIVETSVRWPVSTRIEADGPSPTTMRPLVNRVKTVCFARVKQTYECDRLEIRVPTVKTN